MPNFGLNLFWKHFQLKSKSQLWQVKAVARDVGSTGTCHFKLKIYTDNC